jgi:hypothetical protein
VKTFGDKMEPGDQVIVNTWAYTLSTDYAQNAAWLVMPGSTGRIERVVGANAVVVRFSNGLAAPVHPSAVYPGKDGAK